MIIESPLGSNCLEVEQEALEEANTSLIEGPFPLQFAAFSCSDHSRCQVLGCVELMRGREMEWEGLRKAWEMGNLVGTPEGGYSSCVPKCSWSRMFVNEKRECHQSFRAQGIG